MAEYAKPVPTPNPVSAPFWESAKAHALKVQRCVPGQHWFFYPRLRCPFCHTQDIDWVEVSGKGRVYTYTVVYRPQSSEFEEDVPYVFAVVELEESPNLRMYTNVDDVSLDDIKSEMPVTIKYDDVTADTTLVKFVPA